jgi:hypothetical protein
VENLPSGTLINVNGIERDPTGNRWLVGTRAGQDGLLFVSATPQKTPIKPVDLGKSLREVVAPPLSAAFPDLINAEVITYALNSIKAAGHTVTWVSLATGYTADQRLTLVRANELSHAQYILKHAGLDDKRFTALAGATDLQNEGVRLRFFGH